MAACSICCIGSSVPASSCGDEAHRHMPLAAVQLGPATAGFLGAGCASHSPETTPLASFPRAFCGTPGLPSAPLS